MRLTSKSALKNITHGSRMPDFLVSFSLSFFSQNYKGERPCLTISLLSSSSPSHPLSTAKPTRPRP